MLLLRIVHVMSGPVHLVTGKVYRWRLVGTVMVWQVLITASSPETKIDRAIRIDIFSLI